MKMLTLTLSCIVTVSILVCCRGREPSGEGEGEAEGEGEGEGEAEGGGEGEGEAEGEGEGEGELPTPTGAAFFEALVVASATCPQGTNAYALERFLREAEPSTDTFQVSGGHDAERIDALIAVPSTAISARLFRDCLDEIAACGFEPPNTDPASACVRMFVGTRVENEACAVDEECLGSATCLREADNDCGLCRPLIPVGGSCVAERCDDAGTCRDGVCAARVGVGASCTGWTDCRRPLSCKLNGGSDGTCHAPPPHFYVAGDACVEHCAGQSTGLACVDGACEPYVIVGVGDECIPSGNTNPSALHCVDSIFGGDNMCVVADGSTRGLCMTKPSSGTCLDQQCARGARCVEGACLAEIEDGGTCGPELEQSCHLGSRCADGVCEPRAARGEPCSFQCAIGLTCEDDVCVSPFDVASCPL